MQVSIGWLNELIQHEYDQESLRDVLTSIGLEADLFTPEPMSFTGVYIGKITERENAPDGRGFIYTVDVGEAFKGGSVKVFSTIAELEVGVKYPVALPGGNIGDLEITEREYTGFTSQGKFCCATELELTKLDFRENADGSVEWVDGLWDVDGRALSIFPDCEELDVGTDLAAWLLGDPTVTIDLTSNRADCHSMIGVAREMQVVTGRDLRMPGLDDRFEETPGTADDITIKIDDPHGCRVYAGLVIDKIRMAPSPLWMARKLISVGMRPISNIVDITNIVLYELGQPLHAFDHSLLKDQTIIVRRAREKETMATLDGIVREFTPDDLLIADSTDAVAIAGVMGGYASEVTGNTQKVLLESAWFDPVSVRRTSRRLALRTEAAIRFERGVDPNGIVRAVHRVAYLVRKLQCGEPAPQIAVAHGEVEKPVEIKLNEYHIEKVLGEEIPTGRTEMILAGLGFGLAGNGPQWTVRVPSYRRDIFIAEDLIEEIARHVGYDNLPAEFPKVHMRAGLLEDDIKLGNEIKNRLAGLGLWELNSFPLQGEKAVESGNPLISDAKPAMITNPISEDASYLRTSLLKGVIDTYIRNQKRGAPIHPCFELGKVYWHDGEDFRERKELAIGVLGERAGKKKHRGLEKGFIALKGYIEALLETVYITGYDIISDDSPPAGTYRHWIKREDEVLGVIETVTDEILGGETFERPVIVATFPWEIIRDSYTEGNQSKLFEKLPLYPAADRDLAFVVDEGVAYRRMYDAIREVGGEWLQKVELFDVYRGKQVGENKKNLAVNLTFRHPDRTLTDEEVNEWMNAIVDLVKERTGGAIRDW